MKENQLPDVPKGERLFSVKNAHTNAVYGGLESIPGDNGNLLLASLAIDETRHWYDLEIGEHTNLQEDLIVVRVR